MEGLGLISTPLCAAAFEGQLETIKQLLQKGHYVNLADNEGSTPLHIAAARGHLECTKFLLAHEECNPHALTFDGFSTVYAACKFQNNPEVVKVLIDAGVDCTIGDNEYVTPLHVACKTVKKEIAEVLIKGGADLNATDFNKYTPMMELIEQYGNIKTPEGQKSALELFKLLLDHGASVRCTELNDRSPIFIAVVYGWKDCVQVLLEHGADVNARAADGATPLVLAAQYGDLSIVQLLLQWGADQHIKCHNGSTPLHLAIHNGHVSVARELVLKMNDDDDTDKDVSENMLSFTILAIDSGSLESVKFVVENKLTRPNDSAPMTVSDVRLNSHHFPHYQWQIPLSFLLCNHIDKTYSLAMMDCLLQSDSCSVNVKEGKYIPPLCALIGTEVSDRQLRDFQETRRIFFYKLLEKGADIDYCSVIFEEYIEGEMQIPDAVMAVIVPEKCSTCDLLLPVLAHCFSCDWDKLLEWLFRTHLCCAPVVRTMLSLAATIPISVVNLWTSAEKCNCVTCSEIFPTIQEKIHSRVGSLQSLARSALRSWLWEKTHQSLKAEQLLKELKLPKTVEAYVIPKRLSA